MAASNVCWGIEVGKGAIKALKLQAEGDEVRVLDFAIVPHKRVLSTPELDVSDAIRLAMGELNATRDLTGARIAISVPGDSAFARFAKLPPVEPKKIPDIVKFEAVQQIPFPIDDVEWDYQTFASPDSPDVEVGIFAITRDRVMERLATWQEFNLTPHVVTLSPISVYNALAWDMNFTDKTPGTVLLDVGTTSTDLIVAEAGRVWIRTFPIGGHQFTEKLVEAFKLSYPKAETLKRQAEQSTHARQVFQAMRPVFSDLAQDVQRSIGYYQSLHRDANLTRLIGLGSTFALPGLRKFLSQQLQMEVMRLEKFQRITLDGPLAAEFEASAMNLATAYGLALQGLEYDFGISANLMPVSVTRQSLWKRKVKWFGVAAGLSLVAGGAWFVRPFMNDVSAESAEKNKPASIQEAIGLLNEQKGSWDTVKADFKPEPKAAVMLKLLGGRDVMPGLIDDAGQIVKSGADSAGAVSQTSDNDRGKFRFVNFTTRYIGPAVATGEIDPSTGQPVGGDPASLETADRRVQLSLEFNTSLSREQAEQRVVRALQKWLNDNAVREGVPYKVDVSSIRFDPPSEIKISAEGDANAPAPAAPLPPSPGASGPRFPGQTTPGVLPPGGGGPRPMRDERDGGLPPGIAPPGGGPGDQFSPPSNPGAPAPGREDVERMAPLPRAAPDGKPGTSIFRYRLRWEVVIPGPKPPEGQA